VSRKTWLSVMAAAAFLLGTAGLAGAEEKQPAGTMTGCSEHHAAAMKASDAVSMHLAEARRAGTIAEMRRHVEMAEKSMAEMKEHMSMCMEGMDGMHGGMMGEEKGMMGSTSEKTTTPTAAAKVVDPVCGMEVDPAKAPKATYLGKTYYFCSEEDKAKFEKNPGQYVPKKS
jgi:YHS domain-containing protein